MNADLAIVVLGDGEMADLVDLQGVFVLEIDILLATELASSTQHIVVVVVVVLAILTEVAQSSVQSSADSKCGERQLGTVEMHNTGMGDSIGAK